MKKIFGFSFLILGLGIFFYALYANSKYSELKRTFSPYTLISSSWEKYKLQFLNKDGRIIDYSQKSITTSEGQSYALLRSVWVDDKETFDLVWKWTKENLKRRLDNLFGWRWGQKQNKKYGFIEGGGENSASDADTDIALALIFAANRWGDAKYKEEAKKILEDIWKYDTDKILGKRYVLAGNWAKDLSRIIVNPSYFAPYAWRIFAKFDKDHDWKSLIDSSYQLLNLAGKKPLDKKSTVGLPPDWIAIQRRDGKLIPSGITQLTTNYSYDAMRIPFRIALDYKWNKEQKAYDYLSESFSVLEENFLNEGKLYSAYSHDGKVLDKNENSAMYATILGYFIIVRPEIAQKIYQEKIIKLYSNDTNSFNDKLSYYEQNWLWFGTAIYNNYLVPYVT